MRTNVLGRVGSRRLVPAAALALATVAGCSTSDDPPYPSPRLGPVGQIERGGPMREPYKPLPGPESGEPPLPPFNDVPLVYQRPPEQQAFVDAYNAVRRPKLAIFVNRSLLGDGLPVEAVLPDPPAPTGVDLVQGNPFRGGDDRRPPDPNVRPGVYDEAYAKQIDYATIENVLTQWLAADGQTTILSPATVRERLSPDEVRRLQDGRPRVLGELVKELNADVLVYVQGRPTRQTRDGLEVRLNAEAINIRGGEQIARATVLVPPPLDTETVNRFTRFVARKLMADMTGTWTGPGPGPGGARDAGEPPPPAAGGPTSPAGPSAAPAEPPPTRPAGRPPAGEPPTGPSLAPPATPSGGQTVIPPDAVAVPTPTARDGLPPIPVDPPPAPAADRPAPAEAPPPPDRAVPPEKPSILDRPSSNTGPQPPADGEPVQSPPVQKPSEQYPPPPASSGRQGD